MDEIAKEVVSKELKELFPDNALLLEHLAEEAGEIIQAKSKILRFGLNDVFNNTNKPDKSNQEKLENEIGHFLAVVDVLVSKRIIREEKIEESKITKWQSMYKWNAYKGTKGDL